MAITAKWYAKGLQAMMSGSINWTSDTIKVAAFSSSYTPNQATDQFFGSLTGELPTANGYTAGGQLLASKSIALNSLTTALKAAATTWTPGSGQTLSINKLVVYKDTSNAATSPVLGYVTDLKNDGSNADVSATNAAWTATWDATDGVLKDTAS